MKQYSDKKEVVVVDPLFISLRESLVDELDKEKPAETKASDFSLKQFFDHFLSENRPIVVRNYASEWQATEKWSDNEYLAENAGNSIVRLHAFTRNPLNDIKAKKESEYKIDHEIEKPSFSSKNNTSEVVKEFSQHKMKETSSLQPI